MSLPLSSVRRRPLRPLSLTAVMFFTVSGASTKTNVGFVPLVNFRLLWNFARPAGLLLEGDALAAPQGRTEDVLAAVTFQPAEWYTLRLGYRILEGRADNDEVYNFTMFQYVADGESVVL
jgi:hypothetical protein